MSRPAVTYLTVRAFPIIRISCNHKGCDFVFELPPKKVEAAMAKTNACCPLCGRPFTKPDVEGGANVITMLAKTIVAMNELASNVRIELPVTVGDDHQ